MNLIMEVAPRCPTSRHVQVQKFAFLLHCLVEELLVNTQHFCGYPSVLDAFKNHCIANHLSCFHPIFFLRPQPCDSNYLRGFQLCRSFQLLASNMPICQTSKLEHMKLPSTLTKIFYSTTCFISFIT